MTLENGNLFLFDNGFNRQFIPGAPTYSRAVEYRINEADKTVQQIWQYGKERGVECWAPIISDVDVLMNTNRLITCGIVFGAEPYAKLIEVSYPDKSVVYEITLHFKNLLADGGLAWGGLDLNYRSERLDIYPKQ
jgi:arylsulfate sulfotransferase